MRVLFVIRSTSHFHYVQSVLEALFRRGHEVLALFEHTREKWLHGEYTLPIEEFKTRFPTFTYGQAFSRTDLWRRIVMPSRVLLNYRRFLFAKNQSDYFRERNVKYLPFVLRLFLKFPGAHFLMRSALSSRLLNAVENAAGVDAKILQQVKNSKADVVLATLGGMRYGTMDFDYIKAAQALGIKTAVLALSWDSVSNKAYLQIKPDVFLLWNEIHKEQAVSHHGVLKNNIRIIGAPMFDSWFSEMRPSLSREEFCRKHGLDSNHPIIVYLGSPSTITADERWLIREVREYLNESGETALKNAQMIFRPHPAHAKLYRDLNLDGVSVFPKGGEIPDIRLARKFFYDTMHHAAAVVAVNTSAMIDAIITDKPIIVLMRNEYSQTQSKAEHFKAMLRGNAFSLTYSKEDFLKTLKNILEGQDDKKKFRAAFVQNFIRPRGLNKIAGEAVVDELERLI